MVIDIAVPFIAFFMLLLLLLWFNFLLLLLGFVLLFLLLLFVHLFITSSPSFSSVSLRLFPAVVVLQSPQYVIRVYYVLSVTSDLFMNCTDCIVIVLFYHPNVELHGYFTYKCAVVSVSAHDAE